MASKSGARATPEKQRKPSDNQTSEGSCSQPAALQVTKSSKSEPVNPRKLPNSAQQVPSKPVSVATAVSGKSGNSTKQLSLNSLADEIGTSLSLANLKQVQTCMDPEVSETKGLSKGNSYQEKKTLEPEISPTSDVRAERISSLEKTSGSVKASDQADFVESGKTSMCRGSTSSNVSDESTCSSFSSSMNKPHKANDMRWEAIQAVRTKDGLLGLSHFRLLKRLGCGDIGSVHLAELTGTKCYFAMKIMDKASLASRKKLLRAQTEREILQSLDHPFLPTLYTHFESDKFSCLVMEFCPGGDLHTLRQRQPGKHFSEQAVKYENFPPCSVFVVKSLK